MTIGALTKIQQLSNNYRVGKVVASNYGGPKFEFGRPLAIFIEQNRDNFRVVQAGCIKFNRVAQF